MNASNPISTTTYIAGEYDSPLITPSEDSAELVRGRATTFPSEEIGPDTEVTLSDQVRNVIDAIRDELIAEFQAEDDPDDDFEKDDFEFDVVERAVITPERFTAKVAAPCGCEEYVVLDLELLDDDDRADAEAILETFRELILRNHEEAVENDVPVTQIIVVE